ncbi:MAG: cytochrome c, partial [Pseudomonas sp.]|nr:cytochrome c [Pseudomonas sp.]
EDVVDPVSVHVSRAREAAGMIALIEDESGETRAKDDVWQRQARFQELARAMEASTAALVVATHAQPLTPEALTAPMQRVEDSCKACHEEFRAF